MSDEATKAPTEVQPDLFPNLPKVPALNPAPTDVVTYDALYPPGQRQFPGWDPFGTEEFHGPASD
jgi:hypothetical protein